MISDAEKARIINQLFSSDDDDLLPPAASPTTREPETFVYFVASRGFIKIGLTTNWKSRLSSLQVANPDPLEVLLILGRPSIFEKTMHREFAKHHAKGEWFKDHQDIRDYIESRKDECWFRASRPEAMP